MRSNSMFTSCVVINNGLTAKHILALGNKPIENSTVEQGV